MGRARARSSRRQQLSPVLEGYAASTPAEQADLGRARRLLATASDPFDRTSSLHLTGSAVVVHPETRRVLLRWHERQGAWLQVGGHGDPGEGDPFEVALREAREETGLEDLRPWGSARAARQPVHVVVVAVNARGDEAAHEHVDVRFVLSTSNPDAAVQEDPVARLQWLVIEDAVASVPANLSETLRRITSDLR